MEIKELALKGAKLIKPLVFRDERGYFLESYQKDRFEGAGIFDEFVQDNHSFSKKGTLRGMHFQSFPGQAKCIFVISGKILDVIVDIRADSPTFKRWEGVILDDENHQQLFIPVGFAHGFCVLSDEAHVVYKVSNFYDSNTEKGFRYDDPDIGIKWPVQNPILSKKDAEAPYFRQL